MARWTRSGVLRAGSRLTVEGPRPVNGGEGAHAAPACVRERGLLTFSEVSMSRVLVSDPCDPWCCYGGMTPPFPHSCDQ